MMLCNGSLSEKEQLQSLQMMKDILAYCKKNNIKRNVFTSTMYWLQKNIQDSSCEYLKKLNVSDIGENLLTEIESAESELKFAQD